MFRNICSAVERLVTTAVTLRLPPQGHCHTSTAQVEVERPCASGSGKDRKNERGISRLGRSLLVIVASYEGTASRHEPTPRNDGSAGIS